MQKHLLEHFHFTCSDIRADANTKEQPSRGTSEQCTTRSSP